MSRPPNQMPQFGRGAPQFAGPVPVIGSAPAQPNAGQVVAQVGLQLYQRVAYDHIADNQPADSDCLRQLAADAHLAARVYFETAGLIPEQSTDGD